jgi:beta-1,2-mannobiose phosphorylase / 1,2-beta-oligomannan phosphorylase
MEKKLIIRKEDIKPSREDFEVIGTFNPGCIKFNDETLLMIRVAERPIQNKVGVYLVPYLCEFTKEMKTKEIHLDDPLYDFSDPRVIKNGEQNYLTSISHFRLAKSIDGICFEIAETPTIFPETCYETFGIEDPRITQIDQTFYITYSAVSPMGINGCLIKTNDFLTFERMGIIFSSDNKDVVLFPEKINDHYYALHRPTSSIYGKLDIWLAKSPDLTHWGQHDILLQRRPNNFDSYRLGGSAVPFKTEHGWLEIYHSGTIDHKYALAAVLLKNDDPLTVLKRSTRPFIKPEEHYETNGFFEQVVFSCGAISENNDVWIYYGVSDENIACAKMSLQEILDTLA